MSDSQSHRVRLLLLIVACLGLAACSNLDGASNRIVGLVTPYKIDIVQGNFVSKEQAAALKPGLTRIQVRDILGTPLLTSVFHADRWDYVFTFKRQGLAPQSRKLTVFFSGDTLTRFEADELPSEVEFVKSLDSGRTSGPLPSLQMTDEAIRQLPVPAQAAAPKPLPPLPASYPPLEPASR